MFYPAEPLGWIWFAKVEKFKLLTSISAIAEYANFVTT